MANNYRPDIDGLRAIAVLLVVIYHARFEFSGHPILQAGFLGVDVFFVISGFLITKLLLTELETKGEINLKGFYMRRARRLLPALLLVMVVSIYYSYKYLLPTQLIDYAFSLVSSLGFFANFYWQVTLDQYGAESDLLKPFLHTWSLSVEEQFYLLFPISLIAIYKLKSGRRPLLAILSLLAISSFILAIYTSREAQSISFYYLHTRLWELLSGAIVAILIIGKSDNLLAIEAIESGAPNPTSNILKSSGPFLGVVLILVSAVSHLPELNHPGLGTLLTVFGTCLILGNTDGNNVIARALATKPMRYIGLLSYSLYLWHYPIFAFTYNKKGSIGTTTDKLELIVLAFILAIISFIAIEKPFRNRELVSNNRFFAFLAMAVLFLSVSISITVYKDQKKERFTDLTELYGANEYDNAILKEESVKFVNNPPAEAGFKESSQKTKILIIGNSHAKDFYNVFVQNLDIFSDFEFEHMGLQIATTDTDAFIKDVASSPKFTKAEHVLISNRYMPPNRHHSGDLNGLKSFIENLKAHGKNVIVTSNTVEFKLIEGNHVFDWYVKNSRLFNRDELKQLFYKQIDPGVKIHRNDGAAHIARITNSIYLDKFDFMCDRVKMTCDGITPDGFKSFYDKNHYTLNGAKYFGKRIHLTGWLKLTQ